MAKANRLNQRDINRIMADGKEGVYGDGHGLYLRLRGNCTSGQWIQILRVDGKRTERGLGGYPIVSLAEAREVAFDNRRAVKHGKNPWIEKQTIKPKVPTFAQALEAVIALKRDGWKGGDSERQWRSSIHQYAGKLLEKRVDEIRTKDVLACLEPIWHEKHVTAGRVKTRIDAVMQWAIGKDYRQDNDNPVKNVGGVLKTVKRKVKRHKALDYADVPAAMAKIRESGEHAGIVLALRFLILTATRVQETSEANWCEINQRELTWTIPADRMKAGDEHVVPLSDAATDVLHESAKEFGGIAGPIFPSVRGKTLRPSRLLELMQQCGIDATVHGFRSSFRDWSAEHGYKRDIAEAALAHKVRNQVEAAYRRTDFLKKRRKMMERWGEFCVSV